jgi:predicted nucleic-acid-binding protein
LKAIDTNVLVRLLIEDDTRQAAAIEAFIQGGAWVPTLALAESVWVLRSVYRKDSKEVLKAVEMLLEHQWLVLQDAEAVAGALDLSRARPSLGFTDCLLLELARKNGHLPLGTFDKNLANADGAERL